MARLSMSTQNKEKDNAPKSCFNLNCDDTMCLPRCFRLVLPVTMFSLVLPLIVRGNADVLEKAGIPAFPGAEGAGAFTSGGRGGRIFEVTNLNDAGPGSLREAIEAEGVRIVIFRVSGIITLEKLLTISNPYITVAGQTAPGDGICIRGQTTEINTHDVVLRYLRFRRGNIKDRNDALGGYPVGNIIVDHCSASWGLDENLSLPIYEEDAGRLGEKNAGREYDHPMVYIQRGSRLEQSRLRCDLGRQKLLVPSQSVCMQYRQKSEYRLGGSL